PARRAGAGRPGGRHGGAARGDPAADPPARPALYLTPGRAAPTTERTPERGAGRVVAGLAGAARDERRMVDPPRPSRRRPRPEAPPLAPASPTGSPAPRARLPDRQPRPSRRRPRPRPADADAPTPRRRRPWTMGPVTVHNLQITASAPDPALLDLPWDIPLEEWPAETLAALPRGISRHIVRFVRLSG